MPDAHKPVVHLELHTGDLAARACALRASCAAGGRSGSRRAHGSYLALDLGNGIGGGIVECDTSRPIWLPYVEVRDIRRRPTRPASWGPPCCSTLVRDPAGWRRSSRAPTGGEIAFWQQKR